MEELGLTTVLHRLKALLHIKYKKDIAEKIGLTQAALTERLKRDAIPYKNIIDLCLEHNININILFQKESEYSFDLKEFVKRRKDFTPIDHYIEGYSTLHKHEYKVEYAIQGKFSPDNIKAVTCKSNEMAPTIKINDIVILDTTIEKIDDQDGKLYLLQYNGLFKVARLFYTPTPGLYILRFDNPLYPDMVHSRKEFIIKGKVLSIHANAS